MTVIIFLRYWYCRQKQVHTCRVIAKYHISSHNLYVQLSRICSKININYDLFLPFLKNAIFLFHIVLFPMSKYVPEGFYLIPFFSHSINTRQDKPTPTVIQTTTLTNHIPKNLCLNIFQTVKQVIILGYRMNVLL